MFEGIVLGVEREDTAHEPGVAASSMDFVLVRLRALRAWKGITAETVTVATHEGGASCGFGFRVGERYLVYAYGARGRLTTNICTRTTAIDRAWSDLRDLGAARWQAQP